jgi:hypothetical protein
MKGGTMAKVREKEGERRTDAESRNKTLAEDSDLSGDKNRIVGRGKKHDKERILHFISNS